jgi:hypothetical protein
VAVLPLAYLTALFGLCWLLLVNNIVPEAIQPRMAKAAAGDEYRQGQIGKSLKQF